VERKTRRDRRARFDLEALEGRKVMSAGSGTGINLEHLESRRLLAAAPQQVEISSIPKAVHLSAHHPLLTLEAPKPVKPAITAAVTGPHANGSVTFSGRTFPKAKVSLVLQAGGTIERTVKANAVGQFHVTCTVGFGSTPVRLVATAPGHRATSTTLTVTRIRPPVTLPPAPPSTTNQTVGGATSQTVGGTTNQTTGGIGQLLTDFGPFSAANEWSKAFEAVDSMSVF
jgi:hypothetical protein